MVSVQELVNEQAYEVNLELHVDLWTVKQGRLPSGVGFNKVIISRQTPVNLLHVNPATGQVTLRASQAAHMLLI